MKGKVYKLLIRKIIFSSIVLIMLSVIYGNIDVSKIQMEKETEVKGLPLNDGLGPITEDSKILVNENDILKTKKKKEPEVKSLSFNDRLADISEKSKKLVNESKQSNERIKKLLKMKDHINEDN